MRLSINGVNIKEPHDFNIERYNITKANRTASGLMNMDLIAKKRKFLFKYDVLSGAEFDKILNIIDSNRVFFTLRYEENGRMKSAVVYCGAIKAKKYRSNLGWYWTNITFNLIER